VDVETEERSPPSPSGTAHSKASVCIPYSTWTFFLTEIILTVPEHILFNACLTVCHLFFTDAILVVPNISSWRPDTFLLVT
jgi:hypothetical protein